MQNFDSSMKQNKCERGKKMQVVIEISLKAKGLLSLMLSLPEDWDYTTKGLAHICKDGVDSITTALKELERHIK